jgi:hypothetical protein
MCDAALTLLCLYTREKRQRRIHGCMQERANWQKNVLPPRVDRVCWEAMVCRVWKYGSWMGVVFYKTQMHTRREREREGERKRKRARITGDKGYHAVIHQLAF